MTETDYPERRSIHYKGKISELLTAIALPLALILVVDTSTLHGGRHRLFRNELGTDGADLRTWVNSPILPGVCIASSWLQVRHMPCLESRS
jgi:hypothetical protein